MYESSIKTSQVVKVNQNHVIITVIVMLQCAHAFLILRNIVINIVIKYE